jgi:hypothetical protein
MSPVNDWFFALFNPFDAWYQDPSNEQKMRDAVAYFMDRGMKQAAASIINRHAAFDPESGHKVIDDSFVYGDKVFTPCTCGAMWPSWEAALDHVRNHYVTTGGNHE